MCRRTIKTQATKDLNIRHNTIKIPEENIGKISSDISHTNVFLGQSPKAIAKKNQIGPNQTIKRQPTDWGKIFANDVTDKGLVSKIYKQLTQLHIKITNNQIKKEQRT